MTVLEHVLEPGIEGFRLSPQQRLLWGIAGEGEWQSFRTQCLVCIEGPLDLEALRQAVAALVDRHEVLRTAFYCPQQVSVPLQVIGVPSFAFHVETGGEDWQARLDELLVPIEVDLQRGPVLDLWLARLSPQIHMLRVSLSSLCMDAAGLRLLIREMSMVYEAQRNGGLALAEPVQYADAAEWLNRLLESPEAHAERSFWRQAGWAEPEPARLPFEGKAPSGGSFEPVRTRLWLEPVAAAAVDELAARCGVPAQAVLLAGWRVLLDRLTGSEAVVAVRYDGRLYEELESALGPFEKYLPLRCRLPEEVLFEGALRQIAAAMDEAGDLQEYFSGDSPGEPVDISLSALLSYAFQYDEAPVGSSVGDLAFTVLDEYACSQKSVLKLRCQRRQGGILLELHSDPRRIPREETIGILQRFRALLQAALMKPQTPIAELDLVDEPARHYLLVECNDTDRVYSGARAVQELFELQAARRPEAFAAVCEGDRLSYGELNARANQLGRYLRRQGTDPEARIALYLERSLDLLISLLGVLKAGAAYVPLEPGQPAERLEAMLEEAGPALVVTSRGLAGEIPAGFPLLVLDAEAAQIALESKSDPVPVAVPQNLAYLLFTSGSTGRPKAVAVEHGQLTNYIEALGERIDLAPCAAFATVTTFAADLGHTVIFPALCGGGCLHIIGREHALDPGLFADYVTAQAIDCLKVVPSHLEALLVPAHAARLLPRKRLILGGEAFRWDLLDRVRQFGGADLAVYNHYGPTETTVGVLTCHVEPSATRRTATVPLGRPIPNARAYVFGPGMRPVPAWIPGELFIGGACVSRGYFGRPESTAERFLPDPFAGLPGARLYRTGDLVRSLPDGTLEFLGRVDHQVKIRGFRIELGEIESHLRALPGVEAAVVVVREDAVGAPQLVAYPVLREERLGAIEILRTALQQLLPEPMIPSFFMPLKALPLTDNGKVDRRALPPPTDAEAVFEAPRTHVEQMLAGIWTILLGRERVGVRDDFFRLGGHSLLVTQLVARIEEAFDIELPLALPFDRPVLEDLAISVEAILRERQGVRPSPILPRQDGQDPELSFAQQRLWFLQRFEPSSPVYNVAAGLTLAGRLEIPALRRALSEIVRRHEVLRSSFPAVDGAPSLLISLPYEVLLPVVDLSRLEGSTRDNESRRLVAQQVQRPFDLESGPLLRLLLLLHSAQEHLLLFSVHHIVSDAWSRAIFIRELATLYRPFSRGESSPLPELPIQYSDYARWQREWLSGGTLERLLGSWRNRLAGVPALLLPTDRPRPAVLTHRGTRQRFLVPRKLVEALTEQSLRHETTLFMTLASAFEGLMYRYSGQEDFGVGTPMLHRGRVETEGLIGLFLNTLVLRADLAGEPTFTELLARMRAVVLEALIHQDLPFEKLVEELQLERELSQSPLFQVMFTLQNAPRETLDIPGLAPGALELPNPTSKFDLTMHIEADPGGDLVGLVEYRTDLFDATTMTRLIGHLRSLLVAVAADSEQPVSALPLKTDAERHQLLTEWNDTRVEGLAGACAHQLFERQAELRPDAVAVQSDNGEELTYGELESRVNRLAHYLKELGVGPEVRVGLCLHRTPAMIVGLLGVQKSGGAYVPLDPGHPRERLALVLEDAGLTVLLTEEALRDELPGVETVCLDSDWDRITSCSDARPEPRPDLDQPAYVIFTSGSTGRPKGVEVTHRALVNFLGAMAGRPGLLPEDRWLAVTTLAFDIAALEILLPLVVGGRLVLASRQTASDPVRLAHLLATSEATVMQATPATWQMLLDIEWPGGEGLKALCGGEALPADLAARLGSRTAELWNMYGPTETTIWSAARSVEPAEEPVLVGGPIANTSIYLLDRSGMPVPLGVPGEVSIGGEGLARGYLGRPELTAERFVPDPFASRGGGRLYRTGDLALRRPGGGIEFLGRIDHQVKLRGFRIELGEIEAALRRHPAISEAVVTLWRDGGADQRLVAYLVLREGLSVASSELRTDLAEVLPDYMIPSGWMFLAALPRTPNGKVDRNALPAPEPLVRSVAATAPRTPLESRLAELWAEVLGRREVGVDESFFELGGHSLLAVRLLFRVNEELGVDVPLRTLFEQPTVEGLAVAVDRVRAEGGDNFGLAALPRIVPDPERRFEPFPLNDVQHAYWIGRSEAFDLGNVASHSYREVSIPGLDLERFGRVLDRLISRHDMLRAVVLPDGRQRILDQVPPYRIEVTDLHGQSAATMEHGLTELRRRMSQQMLPTDHWPLFDLHALLLDGGAVRLHISFDYLIADGWSVPLLIREAARLYADPATELLPLDLSFRDCVLADLEQRESAAYARSRAYWLERLERLPPPPELPLVRQPGSIAKPRFARRSVRLGPEIWGRLKARAMRAGLTPSGLLVSAFSEILAAWSKSRRLTLNLTLFNRLPLHPQIESVVGDFTSLTLLAVDTARPGSFETRARAVQEQLWEDLEHRLFSGISLIRELARRQGHFSGALMPVVFTSFLVQADAEPRGGEGPPQEGMKTVFNITQTPQVWLDHQVVESAGGLALSWDAVEDLFPAGLLDDAFAAYRDLLVHLAEREESWQELPCLLPAWQLELWRQVNETTAPVPEGLLHEPLLRQAAIAPDRVAVIDPRLTITYGALALGARRLAGHLRQAGARPNRLVAVVMEKGWEQVLAVTAVLESGAAYLPIDAGLPRERLHILLKRGEVEIALVQPWVEAKLDWPAGIQCIPVEAGLFAAGLESELVASPARQEDLAYVIFTSGSTGQPKGVAIDHRGALNTVVDVNQRFGVGPDDRVLALSSLSFDLSVYDIFGVLAAGGVLVLPEPSASRDPARWLDLLDRHGVTLWNTVPALLEMFVEYATTRAEAPSLHLVLLSGDWIPLSLPDRVRALSPGVEVVSLGGATEASIWSILYPISAVVPDWSSIPYGRAMANQRLYVLDELLAPCPVWVPGQLYIGGIGLALGYWRDEETTRESFIVHPRTGERLYRTGDLGRFLPDGNIEFLGREDLQVKIQGHRIELGEIEAVLERHPEVRAGAVVAVGEDRNRRSLAAFFVPERWEPASEASLVDALRAWLEERLPAYMVPASFIASEQISLTSNSKIDRKVLANQAGSEAPARSNAYVAPRTELQHLIAEIWRSVLGVQRIGEMDNFFDLGGDSVTMVQVYNRLQESLGREISIVQLFANPNLQSLAQVLGDAEPVEEPKADEALQRAEVRRASRQRRRMTRSDSYEENLDEQHEP